MKGNTDIGSELCDGVNQTITIKTQHQYRGKPNMHKLN